MIPFVNVGVSASQALALYLVVYFGWRKFGNKDTTSVVHQSFGSVLFSMRVVVALLWVDALIGSMVIPATHMIGEDVSKSLSPKWEKFSVPVQDASGAILLSAASFSPSEATAADAPVIVFLCPNGASFEQIAPFLEGYASDLGASHIVGFNFRGVGASQGWPRKSQDLVEDARAVVSFVMDRFDKKVHQVVLHGWSLGGAVALAMRETWPSVTVVSDRSFHVLSSVAKNLLREPLTGAGLGIFIGALLSFVLAPTLEEASKLSKYLCFLFGAILASGFVEDLVPEVLKLFQWELDVRHDSIVYSGPLCAIFHRMDGMIPYETSLHRILDTSHVMVHEMELSQEFQNPLAFHMYLVRSFPDEWATLLENCVQGALAKSIQ